MARSNLAAPETISGERSLGTPFADQAVKANAFSNFKSPVGLDLPNAQPDNALSQLGSALSRFNPTLNTIAAQNIDRIDKVDTAEGQARYQKVRKDYAEAVEAGEIPAGASRAYVEAYKSTELNTKQLMFGNSLHKAYEESGLKDSDDPNAMAAFLGDYTKKYREGALMRGGTDRYTTLELAHSKFDEGLQGHTNSLMAQHIQFRANERTEIGKQTAMTNAGLRVSELYDDTDSNSLPLVAQAFKDTFFDPMRGVGMNGIPKSEVNKLMVDTLATKMVEMDDAGIANIAAHIDMGPGSKLAGWPYAKNKFKEAADAIMTKKIRNGNWNYTERDRAAKEAAGVTPEMEAQRTAQSWKEHDTAQQRQLQEYLNKDTVDHNKAQTNSQVSYILKGLDLKQMESPFVKKSFDWLRENNPDAWMAMTNYTNSYKKEKTAFHNTKESDFATVKMRYDMSKNPMGFDSWEVLNAVDHGVISKDSGMGLLDDWDKAKTHMDNPFLQNPGFTSLVNDIQKVVGKDEIDRGGEAAKNAMIVDHQMRRNAYNWIEQNPKGKYSDFIKSMQEQAEPLALAYSPELKKDEARKLSKSSTPQTVTPKDTRSTMEKVLPNAMGGKSKPAPVTNEPTGPKPLDLPQAIKAMKPESRSLLNKMLQDPTADDMDIKAAIYNSGLWAFMKSNGRSSIEYEQLAEHLLSQRKK